MQEIKGTAEVCRIYVMGCKKASFSFLDVWGKSCNIHQIEALNVGFHILQSDLKSNFFSLFYFHKCVVHGLSVFNPSSFWSHTSIFQGSLFPAVNSNCESLISHLARLPRVVRRPKKPCLPHAWSSIELTLWQTPASSCFFFCHLPSPPLCN